MIKKSEKNLYSIDINSIDINTINDLHPEKISHHFELNFLDIEEDDEDDEDDEVENDVLSNKELLNQIVSNLNIEIGDDKIDSSAFVDKLIFEVKNLLINRLSPTLEERCPNLKLWISNKKEMERKGYIKRVATVTPSGKNGSRQENAYEFLTRTLNDAGLETIPYLHEIKQVNNELAKSLYALKKYSGKIPISNDNQIKKSAISAGYVWYK